MPDRKGIGRGFDRLVPVYDGIKRFILGRQAVDLQERLVSSNKQGHNTLIIGGGTGLVLRQCMRVKLSEHYVYAELSGRMMAVTRSGLSEAEIARVTWTTDFRAALAPTTFDYIILPFVLDCYDDDWIAGTLLEFKWALEPDGQILVLDLDLEHGQGLRHHLWHTPMTALLYAFFRPVVGIRATRLPDLDRLFCEAGYHRVWSQRSSHGWIHASKWKQERAIHMRP